MPDPAATPWAVYHAGEGFYRVYDADDLAVSALLARADANLIAATPKLLAAVHTAEQAMNMWERLTSDPEYTRYAKKMRAAIAKAEGRDASS